MKNNQDFVILGIGVLMVLTGCGSKSGSGVTGVASFVKGPSENGRELEIAGRGPTRPSDGYWNLSPDEMAITVTGMEFTTTMDPTATATAATLTGGSCTVTFLKSSGSLAKLADCPFTIAAGTYTGVSIIFSTMYKLKFNDDTNGFYTSSSAPNYLTTTKPSSGGELIDFPEAHSNGDPTQRNTTFFRAPLTVAAAGSPKVSVFFDPTHWFLGHVTSGAVAEKLTTDGDPPIVPSAGELSKGRYYSNASTTGNFLGSNKYGLLVFYADDATPTVVMGRIGHVCQTGSVAENAYNSNGTVWGTYGYLGLVSGVLAWALPDVTTTNTFSTYRAIVKMAEKDTIGDVTQLSYKCTNNVQDPSASGTTYTSAFPTFTEDGHLDLTLLAK